MTSSPHQHLAVDLGASNGRALVGTVVEGRIQVEEVHRFDTPLIEADERLFWDLGVIEREIDAGLDAALRAAPNLRSLSVDAWGVDYVPLNEDGEPVRNPRSYRDSRTHEVMDRTLKRVPPEDVYATTGIQFMPINTLYQVLADHETEPELVERTEQRLSVADYLLYRLSGRAVAERSMASTTQLLDIHTREWATDLMERVGIDPATWPAVVSPGTRLGPLKHSNIQNPTSPIEVVAGCSHDTACAVAAVPADPDGPPWAYLSCGTWSLLGVERDTPILTDAAREASFTNELGLDGTVRFLKNLTGLWVLQECERVWEAEGQTFDHDTLQREAADAASIGEPLDLDDERFLERGRMPAKIRAYCGEHGPSVPKTRGEVVRLVLESLAADYRAKLSMMEDLIDERVEVVHLVGGGARNELLCQWTADATRRPVVAGPAEATALGNLLVQARTMGTLGSGRSIREVVRTNTELRRYEPGDAGA